MSGEHEARWYVVQTRPYQEERALAHLTRQGFATFFPTYERTIRHGRQFRTAPSALFPNYLFVRFRIDQDQWRCVNSTLGVSRLISSGEKPSPVPIGAVEEMISSDCRTPMATFEEGAPIRIATGPFAGLTGSLLRLDPNGRVKVLLSILGGNVPLMIESKVLFPAA